MAEKIKVNGVWDYPWNHKNYDEGLGKVKNEGSFGRMKLVELNYTTHNAKFIMLDDNNRVQWTTFEFMGDFMNKCYDL